MIETVDVYRHTASFKIWPSKVQDFGNLNFHHCNICRVIIYFVSKENREHNSNKIARVQGIPRTLPCLVILLCFQKGTCNLHQAILCVQHILQAVPKLTAHDNTLGLPCGNLSLVHTLYGELPDLKPCSCADPFMRESRKFCQRGSTTSDNVYIIILFVYLLIGLNIFSWWRQRIQRSKYH